MVKANKNERAIVLKEKKHLCREFRFTVGMLNGLLAERLKKK